ncbi:MAG: type II secretion system protein GspD, partial [Gammaproteobacteria bacterium]|nr:type II secretion system protein GspD [Gammaproteobacteria bacterium]
TAGTPVINPFQTVQRQDVGLELKITPQINQGNSVLLKIDQVISNLTGNSIGGQPVTNTREIKTSVMAQDHEIVVLGGLIEDDLIESEQHVPVLGSIPLLGNLFKYRSTTNTKSNLMLFIQPTILNNPATADQYTSQSYNQMRDIQLRNQGPVQLMPGEQRPVLQNFNKVSPPPAVPTATTHAMSAPAPASRPTPAPAAATKPAA